MVDLNLTAAQQEITTTKITTTTTQYGEESMIDFSQLVHVVYTIGCSLKQASLGSTVWP